MVVRSASIARRAHPAQALGRPERSTSSAPGQEDKWSRTCRCRTRRMLVRRVTRGAYRGGLRSSRAAPIRCRVADEASSRRSNRSRRPDGPGRRPRPDAIPSLEDAREASGSAASAPLAVVAAMRQCVWFALTPGLHQHEHAMDSHPSSHNLAARMARWSSRHRKKAFWGWLAFVILALRHRERGGVDPDLRRRQLQRRVPRRRGRLSTAPGFVLSRRSCSSRATSSPSRTRSSRPRSPTWCAACRRSRTSRT